MKKTFFVLCAALVAATSSFAQTLNIHFKNGTSVEFSKELIDYVDFAEKATEPTLTAGEAVDLGLSVKWASCNLGAESPEESGYYYAWGETSPKNVYTKENYAYYNSTTTEYIRIGEDISGTQYDAATVNLGKGWSMPTKDEVQELNDKCTWKWSRRNGVNGYVVTGTNGNSIFLPAKGYKWSSFDYYINEEIYLWTSETYPNNKVYARNLYGDSNVHGLGYNGSSNAFFRGLPIRPVQK